MKLQLFDMHCHLDFCCNPYSVAQGLARDSIGCFSQTITPQGYEDTCGVLGDVGNVRVGVGMHPWEVASDKGALHSDFDHFAKCAQKSRWIGEVGLDFSPQRVHTKDGQLWMFKAIAELCSREGEHVVSIHAVQSASHVLDVLEETRMCARNTCIFHWFSGTDQEFKRALEMGCCFSFGPRSLATKRGIRFVSQAPLASLLLETDAPSSPQNELGACTEASEENPACCISAPLEFALTEMCARREEDPDTVATSIRDLSETLLDLH